MTEDCCLSLQSPAQGLQTTPAREGSTQNLHCDSKLKCILLSLTVKGLDSSFILSNCSWIEKPRHPVFLWEQKDTAKYFHAGLIPSDEKSSVPKSKTRNRFYQQDTLMRLHSHSWWSPDKTRNLFNHLDRTIYRLVSQCREYQKTLAPMELMVEVLTLLAQMRFLTVNLHSSQLEMCWSKSNSNFSDLKDTQQRSK